MKYWGNFIIRTSEHLKMSEYNKLQNMKYNLNLESNCQNIGYNSLC